MWLPSNKKTQRLHPHAGQGKEGGSVGEGRGREMDGWIIDKMPLWCKTTFADGSRDTNPNFCVCLNGPPEIAGTPFFYSHSAGDATVCTNLKLQQCLWGGGHQGDSINI